VGFCGKRGVVFALAGAPVSGGAEGRGGSCVTGVVSFDMLGIGLVTAVDQAGGRLLAGAGSNWPEVLIGSVEAADTLGRGVGVIFDVAGLSGRGGRLMRKVSRLGAFGSEPSGAAESAIIRRFYSYSGKCSMAKFAIVTYLCSYRLFWRLPALTIASDTIGLRGLSGLIRSVHGIILLHAYAPKSALA